MQPEFLGRLSKPVQQFVREVELGAGLLIQVALDPRLNRGGPTGQGNLAVDIKQRRIVVSAPTNGYFTDGAVRHEVLHAKRIHVDGVPMLVLANAEPWDQGYADALAGLDNAIEHVFIVPTELQLHPERREHWEAMMAYLCGGLAEIPCPERRLAIFMHWTFLKYALPGSPSNVVVKDFGQEHGLFEAADRFADEFTSLASKEQVVRLVARHFPERQWNRAAFEYMSSVTGTRQESIL
jgi:hypothetical protein